MFPFNSWMCLAACITTNSLIWAGMALTVDHEWWKRVGDQCDFKTCPIKSIGKNSHKPVYRYTTFFLWHSHFSWHLAYRSVMNIFLRLLQNCSFRSLAYKTPWQLPVFPEFWSPWKPFSCAELYFHLALAYSMVPEWTCEDRQGSFIATTDPSLLVVGE